MSKTPVKFVTASSLLRECPGAPSKPNWSPVATRDTLTMDDAELAAKRQEEDAEVALGQKRVDERRALLRRERMAEDDARAALVAGLE
jgi:hypothetical protein